MESKEEGKFDDEDKALPGAKDTEQEMDSDEEAAMVEREFKALMSENQEGEIKIANDPKALAIVDGFKINWMNMRDGETGELMWESGKWGSKMWSKELKARIPAEILQCSAVSREINFSSVEVMENFKLEQKIFFQGTCIEEWFFDFGFVIPGSTNSWQQIIEAADPEDMLPAEMISGEITIETSFFDGDLFIAKSVVRIYYV